MARPKQPPLRPWGNGTFSTGPSPAPEFPVAAATPPLRPLAPLVRATVPSPITAALPPIWVGGAATPTWPFPQPLGSPGGVPCGGQAPALPPSPPLGDGTFPTRPSPVPEIPHFLRTVPITCRSHHIHLSPRRGATRAAACPPGCGHWKDHIKL